MEKLLLNLSGHPAPKGAEEVFEEVISVSVPNVDMAELTSVYEAARSLVRKALESADSKAKEAIRRGEAAVILPGASALAGAVLAVLVGVSGTFPGLYWAVRTENGFVLSEGMDLSSLRLEGRSLREE